MNCEITVFTPTYNRAYCLDKLYNSLCRQTLYDFEWLIVDDDSTDETEKLIRSFERRNNPFRIRYYKMKHGGKHRAINYALNFARGRYFFIVDSDDYLLDNAIEKVVQWIHDISNKRMYAGVAGLKIHPNGNICGWDYDKEYVENEYHDVNNFERDRYNLLGDKAEVYKTRILRKFPFPEFKGEYFVTEAVCWDAIASKGYKLRWVNSPIYVCEYLDDGLTKTGANEIKGHLDNYKGFCYYIGQSLKILPVKKRIVSFMEYELTRKEKGLTFFEGCRDIKCSYTKGIAYKVIIMLYQRVKGLLK